MNASDILINVYLAALSQGHWEFLLPCRAVEKSVNHNISSQLISSLLMLPEKEKLAWDIYSNNNKKNLRAKQQRL